MSKTFIIIAAVLGMTGVALGAFGAHGLESTLAENGREDTFQTASEYHLIHALALLGVAWVATNTQYEARFVRYAGWLLTIGVLIFSGSLYVLAVFDLGIMGAIAPIGGTAMIAGWGLLGYAAWRA